MSSLSTIFNSLGSLLAVLQTNPALLIFLVALAALFVAALALKVVHAVVSKK